MKKKLPTLTSDAEAEAFVATADLSEYDLTGMVPVRFELKPKDKSVNLRLPAQLVEAVQTQAKRVGMFALCTTLEATMCLSSCSRSSKKVIATIYRRRSATH
jgi:predicted DNA binding CopG/RHH family protein